MRWYKTLASGYNRWELENDAGSAIACIYQNRPYAYRPECYRPEWEYSIYDNELGGRLQVFPDHVQTFEEKKAYVAALARLE